MIYRQRATEVIMYGSELVAEVLIEQTSTRRFLLMKEDFIRLDFTLDSPIMFRIGSYIDDEIFGRFILLKEQMPKYQSSTGGYHYELQFDADYMHLADTLYTLIGVTYDGHTERHSSDFSLTADLYGQLRSWVTSVQYLGYNIEFDPDIDTNFVKDQTKSPKEVECMKYTNIDSLSALKNICNKWGVEFWFWKESRNNNETLCLKIGKCEFGESPIEMELGKNVSSMSVDDSRKNFANRIFAYGGTTNVAYEYRKVLKTILTKWCKAYYKRGNSKVTDSYDYCFTIFTANTENGTLLKKMFSGTDRESSGGFYHSDKCTEMTAGYATNVNSVSFTLSGIAHAEFSNGFLVSASRNYKVILKIEILCNDQVVKTETKSKSRTTVTDCPGVGYYYKYMHLSMSLEDLVISTYFTEPRSGTFKIRFTTTGYSSQSDDRIYCYFNLYPSSYSIKYKESVCPITIKRPIGPEVTVYAYLFDHLADLQRVFEYSHAEITETAHTWGGVTGFEDNVIIFAKTDKFDEASRGGIRSTHFDDNIYQIQDLAGLLFDDEIAAEDEVNSKDAWTDGTHPYGTFEHAKPILIESANVNIPQRLYVSPLDDPSSLLRIGSNRLRLPKDVGDYVQTSEANNFLERKEISVIFNNIYPKLRLKISGIEEANCTEKQTFEGDNDDVLWQYKQYWVQLSYMDNDTLLVFDKSGMIDGETLRLHFVAPSDFGKTEEGYNGVLSGMTFDLEYMPNGDHIGARQTFEGQPCFKILRNNTYGAKLPSELLPPQIGDMCTLEGVNLRFFNGTSIYSAAEYELMSKAEAYLKALNDGQFTFTCTMLTDWIKGMAILQTEHVAGENILPVELPSPHIFNRGHIYEGRTVRILHDSLRTVLWVHETKSLLPSSSFPFNGQWYACAEPVDVPTGGKIVAEIGNGELAFYGADAGHALVQGNGYVEYINESSEDMQIHIAQRWINKEEVLAEEEFFEYDSETLERTFFFHETDWATVPAGGTIVVEAESASSGIALFDADDDDDIVIIEASAGSQLIWTNNTGAERSVVVALTGAASNTSYVVTSAASDVTIKEYTKMHGTDSRVIGYELKLDCPEDGARYTIGETEAYSRLDKLEKEISKS